MPRAPRGVVLLALATVAAVALGPGYAAGLPDSWPASPAATAAAFVLLDAGTGQVLAERAATDPIPVASTVKILTALTVLRRAEMDQIVTIGAEVSGVGGAGVGLRPGDRWTVEQLMDAVVARSGNDAALALAVHVGGSVERFVALMREDARDLGLGPVTLTSPTGLDDGNRLSARDLGVVARAAMTRPDFRRLAARDAVSLPGIGTVVTRNDLLLTYPGATGIKTGYTAASDWSVVGSAQRGDRELIAVVLGSRTASARFADAAALLDHGFEAFVVREVPATVRLRRAGGWTALSTPVAPRVTVPREGAAVEVTPTLPREGDDGELALAWRGAVLARLPLSVDDPPPELPRGAAAVGSWLWDGAYTGMRAVAPRLSPTG